MVSFGASMITTFDYRPTKAQALRCRANRVQSTPQAAIQGMLSRVLVAGVVFVLVAGVVFVLACWQVVLVQIALVFEQTFVLVPVALVFAQTCAQTH